MHPIFADALSQLESSFQALIGMAPCIPLALCKPVPKSGVYLLSEAGIHLYVGRSNRIQKRLGNHCRPSATHKMAAFAFRLARIETGNLKASYKPEGSRAHLMKDPEFVQAFESAKTRIRAMEVRFVEEANPLRQALLEIYAAIALGTPHNDFNTH
jgi:hypothetical protein